MVRAPNGGVGLLPLVITFWRRGMKLNELTKVYSFSYVKLNV